MFRTDGFSALSSFRLSSQCEAEVKTYDTIVIGTGIGGLTCGLSLQREGHSVLLLEAAKQFGGMLNPFARKKWHFDVGIHYLAQGGPGGVLRTDLDSLGLGIAVARDTNADLVASRSQVADLELTVLADTRVGTASSLDLALG